MPSNLVIQSDYEIKIYSIKLKLTHTALVWRLFRVPSSAQLGCETLPLHARLSHNGSTINRGRWTRNPSISLDNNADIIWPLNRQNIIVNWTIIVAIFYPAATERKREKRESIHKASYFNKAVDNIIHDWKYTFSEY